MAESRVRKKEMLMKARFTVVAVLAVAGLLAAVAASPAGASQAITSFESELSTSQAGAHPDIHTKFSLDSPGAPESASEIEFRTPEGIFGNPGAGIKCPPADFALNECPPGTQVGLVTVRALYEGDPNRLMGTGPIYNLAPRTADETGLLAFVVPIVDIPITIPVRVRTGSDYGLSFKVSGISQQVPLAGVDLRIWGNPFSSGHSTERFPSGSPGNPPGCANTITTGCIPGPPFLESGQSPAPFTNNPSICTGAPLPVTLTVWTYQDPDHPSSAETT
jgi:hypothetical protein